ncbi:MAG: glutamate--tRNA ligase [Acidimicrobiales bacterium]
MAGSAVRVRFAPSPTGYFHVGSARTALFNWLFARQRGGTFVLRIEDTDAERNREEWVDGILSAMSWLGMTPDEGPYRQSERADLYREAIESLWAAGRLYACDCLRADVEARTRGNATPGYDGHCRDRGLARSDKGVGRALRFRVPDTGETVVHDVIRGEVTFPHQSLEDFVVVKSSGQPLFVLANVVDDRDMGISHVIRGEDLLPTTPKGVLIWQALDAAAGSTVPLPEFAHLPMLVNEQRKKLSKRRDPVAVEAYRDQGYLPGAFCNYLALLGWSPPGDAEKVPIDVLVDEFRLEDVHHAPAFFDVRKLTHLNGEYVRDLPVADFVSACRPWVSPVPGEWVPAGSGDAGSGDAGSGDAGSGDAGSGDAGSGGIPPWPTEQFDPAVFEAVAPLVQERVATLGEVPKMVDFLFLADPVIDEAGWDKAIARDTGAGGVLDAAVAAFGSLPPDEWTPGTIRAATEAVGEANGRKLAKAQAPIRVAVTGRTVGPPLFESLALLGRDEVVRRLEAARARVGIPGHA